MKTNYTKTQRGITKALLALFALSLVFGNIGYVRADELTDSINNKKDELSSMSSRITTLKDSISAKQKELSSLNNQMEIIDSRVELIQLQIRSTALEMEKTAEEIQKTEEEIKQKEADIESKRGSISNVIKELYTEKNNNALSIIVDSSNFSDMIVQGEYLARIRANLKENLEKLKVLKNELEEQKKGLDQKMKDLDQMKQNKVLEESDLEGQKLAKIQIMQATRGEESQYQAQLSQARAEEQAVSNEIVALVQEQARRKRAEAVQGRDGRGGEPIVNKGGYVNPLPGLNRISITGGDYMDPAYGMGFPHTGIDLAAAQGTTLFSVGTGEVIVARDSGGPGLSYIAIDHGNGIISKYLHVSAIYVNQGDVVNAGDVIGLSGGAPGSHGAGIFTTGSHLHFEINDYNGNAINPHNYFSFAPPLY